MRHRGFKLITIIDGIQTYLIRGEIRHELAIGLSPNPDDKAKAIFSLLDHEGDGAITLENLRVCMSYKVIHAARGNGALLQTWQERM